MTIPRFRRRDRPTRAGHPRPSAGTVPLCRLCHGCGVFALWSRFWRGAEPLQPLPSPAGDPNPAIAADSLVVQVELVRNVWADAIPSVKDGPAGTREHRVRGARAGPSRSPWSRRMRGESVMKYAWISAALVCFASLNSADAGLFGRHGHGCGCAPAPSCCAPAPSCAAPAACAPTCAAPAAAPTCCAPAPAAPTCCAPAPACCPAPSCCDSCCKPKKCHRNWFAGLKKYRGCKKNRCCETSCCAAAPTCAAPAAPSCCAPAAAPTCAAPAAACCH
jgi:hypothetical protein